MKKFFLSVAIVAAMAFAAQAQTDQGTLFLGGSLGFESATSKEKSGNTTTNGPKITNFTIAPGVGFFVADKFAIGADLSYGSTIVTRKVGTTDVKSKGNTFGVRPYVRVITL